MTANLSTMRILFVCTGNIARSQMAEGLARALVIPGVEVASAGTNPNPKGIHPMAIEVLRERGLDISDHRSKHFLALSGPFDYVITLCDDAAQDCPYLPARRERLHWGLPDPVVAGDDPERQRAFFCKIRDEIDKRLRNWLASKRLLAEGSWTTS